MLPIVKLRKLSGQHSFATLTSMLSNMAADRVVSISPKETVISTSESSVWFLQVSLYIHLKYGSYGCPLYRFSCVASTIVYTKRLPQGCTINCWSGNTAQLSYFRSIDHRLEEMNIYIVLKSTVVDMSCNFLDFRLALFAYNRLQILISEYLARKIQVKHIHTFVWNDVTIDPLFGSARDGRRK